MYDPAAKLIYEAVVDVLEGTVGSWRRSPPVPSYLVEYMTGVEEKVREDPRSQETMRKRGVTGIRCGAILANVSPSGTSSAARHPRHDAEVRVLVARRLPGGSAVGANGELEEFSV